MYEAILIGTTVRIRQSSQVCVSSLDIRLFLGQIIKHTVWQAQGILDNLGWGESQPLRDTDIRKLLSLQHLEENDILSASVFDIVRVGGRDVADIAGSEIECARGGRRHEDSDARRALEEVIPLVRFQVPMHLTHSARLHSHKCSGEHRCDREGCGVDDLDRAARNRVWNLLREMVGIGLAYGQGTRRSSYVLCGDVGWGSGAVEDLIVSVRFYS